ncbi:alpha/beta hydrolase [Pokkaliibacter sp. MBI-7]|uniref:alpha/beta hydrolase n=1 Tax=Pokkaliibacter sp. MBI-7 TaxID=3040600 RepID=UPI002446B554|nr:alpha/beta hydrolase [Pokkaliibacter sp. MBI-7]MDH2433804.1 alpha/beta hydrolase [Pokkaliibacter sp. MBI-7]
MALHPEIEAFLELIELGTLNGMRKPLEQQTPERARQEFDNASALLDQPPKTMASVDNLNIRSRDGAPLPLRLYRPVATTSSSPVLLYLHGGGYCVGSLDSHDILCRALASYSGFVVLAVGYRLAPEQRFPTAFNDAVDVYDWLQQQGHELGLNPAQVAVAGDSAGGTLATALCLEARQHSDWQAPVTQVLIYPVTAAEMHSASHQRYAEGHLLEASTLRWFYSNYLNDPAERYDWRFAPSQARDHSLLPPALVIVAECDPLADEAQDYARQLQQAGNKVECRVYAGMTHDFIRMGNMVEEAEQVQRLIGEWVRQSMQ